MQWLEKKGIDPQRITTGIALLVAMSTSSFAQKNYLKEADDLYEIELFKDAIEVYKKAFTSRPVKNDRLAKARIIYNIAVCYRNTNEYKSCICFQ